MEEITPFIKQLISLPGLSGNEAPVRMLIANKWRPLVDELSVSKLGSLHAVKRAKGEAKGRILFAAHMDAIGLMVSGITDGFLHITRVGGIDPRILPGQAVTVHGQKDIPGIAVLLPDRLIKSSEKDFSPKMERILIDTGLDADEVDLLVKIGDLVSFATIPFEMAGGVLAGHSLDNRASVAALTLCLEELRNTSLEWDVWLAATVQEEETLGGSLTSAYEIEPDVAVALDVTFAKGPGASDHRSFPLGKGITIGVGSNIHPYLAKRFRAVAESNEIPHSIEILPASSGTDAIALQIAAAGTPTAVIEIPLRYMHTPVEEVALIDIQRAGRLLARFVAQLDGETLPSLQKEMLL